MDEHTTVDRKPSQLVASMADARRKAEAEAAELAEALQASVAASALLARRWQAQTVEAALWRQRALEAERERDGLRAQLEDRAG